MKTRISKIKDAFNKKISLPTSKLNNELRNKFAICYILSIAPYDSEIWTSSKFGQKYLGIFEMLRWMVMEEIKWLEKVTKIKLNYTNSQKKLPYSL